MKTKSILIWSVFFALLYFLLGNNKLLDEDMVIHIPFIKKIIHPSLYPKDYLFKYSNPQTSLTIYYPLIARFAEGIDLLLVLRILYLAAAFAFCFGVLVILATKGISWYTGVLFLIFLAFRFQVGGTAVAILETEVLPRLLGLVLVIWSSYFFLVKKRSLSVLLGLLGVFLHPLTIVYYLFCVGAYHFDRLRLNNKPLVLLGLSIGLPMSLSLFPPPMDVQWLTMVKTRNSYAFLELWSLTAWANLTILLFPGMISLVRGWSGIIFKKLFITSMSAAIAASVFHIIFVTFAPRSFIVSLQLGRMWLFPVLASLLIVSDILSRTIQSLHGRLLLLVLLLLLVGVNTLRIKENETALISWLTIQDWVRINTDTSCQFLVPYYSKGFRVNSERSITVEHKDGALTFYSPAFAEDWRKRSEDLVFWESKTTSELINLRQRYQFDYILEKGDARHELPVVYHVADYTVYDARRESKCL